MQLQVHKQSRWQSAKNFATDAFSNTKAKTLMIVVPAMTSTTVFAAESALPEITIEVGSLMKAFAVVIAAISVIGMGVLTVALMSKAFKYIRTAL